jgi:hypothetical protein
MFCSNSSLLEKLTVTEIAVLQQHLWHEQLLINKVLVDQ